MPIGPKMTVGQWHAPGRLAYLTFACRCWSDQGRVEWHVLITRVTEKSSKLYQAAMADVHKTSDFSKCRHLIEWSDGPKQMKSGLTLGGAMAWMLKHPDLKHVSRYYGCPFHMKGLWDGLFGIFSRIIKQAARRRKIEKISTVVWILKAWARKEERVHPEGPKYFIKEWMPKHKTNTPGLQSRVLP